MIRVTLLILLFVYSLAGCGPVRQNPIELFPFEYHPSYEVQEVSVQWVVVTATPPPAKTSTVTTSLGVTMGGYDVPVEQLLTEQEQRQIVHALKKVVGQVPKSSCVATVTFEDLDYQFRGHEYWATGTVNSFV